MKNQSIKYFYRRISIWEKVTFRSKKAGKLQFIHCPRTVNSHFSVLVWVYGPEKERSILLNILWPSRLWKNNDSWIRVNEPSPTVRCKEYCEDRSEGVLWNLDPSFHMDSPTDKSSGLSIRTLRLALLSSFPQYSFLLKLSLRTTERCEGSMRNIAGLRERGEETRP